MRLHAVAADLLLSSPPELKTLQASAEPECLMQARATARLRGPTRCTVRSLHVSAIAARTLPTSNNPAMPLKLKTFASVGTDVSSSART